MKAALLIVDGAGLADPAPGNAVTARTMPALFAAMADHGFATLEASGPAVGLGEGEVGNSEVGHLTIGAGYVVPSKLSCIDAAYRNGAWASHPLWAELGGLARLHIVGLLSDAGVHGHWRSLGQAAALAAGAGIREIIVHPVLDGVDSQAGTAPRLLQRLRSELSPVPQARLGVIIGRKWFCDRSGKLELTSSFVDALLDGPSLPTFSDENLETHLRAAPESTFAAHLAVDGRRPQPGEPILVTQHRADRAAQVVRLLAEATDVYTLIEVDAAIPVARVFFPTEPLAQGLGFEFKQRNLHSIRIAESCKFPHVTYFFDGMNKNLEGRHVCLASIPEASIAEKPEMSLADVVSEIEAAIRAPENQVVIANLANLDQVGHLGDIRLANMAAHYVDDALRRILTVCREQGWSALVLSDHGNADRVIDDAGRPFGSHTPRPVPLTAIPAPGLCVRWRGRSGSLANVAPSFLSLLGLPIPAYMAESLLERMPSARPGLRHDEREIPATSDHEGESHALGRRIPGAGQGVRI